MKTDNFLCISSLLLLLFLLKPVHLTSTFYIPNHFEKPPSSSSSSINYVPLQNPTSLSPLSSSSSTPDDCRVRTIPFTVPLETDCQDPDPLIYLEACVGHTTSYELFRHNSTGTYVQRMISYCDVARTSRRKVHENVYHTCGRGPIQKTRLWYRKPIKCKVTQKHSLHLVGPGTAKAKATPPTATTTDC